LPRAAPGMTARPEPSGVRLSFEFVDDGQRGAALANPLIDLLTAVRDTGSIGGAAARLGCSYRHAWGLLRRWDDTLGEPLVVWAAGQAARLTEFGHRLLWAELRARTRMQPHIDALRADLARVVAQARDGSQQVLVLHASHDLALPRLREHAGQLAALHLDIRFSHSTRSLRSLNAGHCLMAGFHVPAVGFEAPLFAKALKPLLKPGAHKLIACSRRVQGLMMRHEHAGTVGSVGDLPAAGLRFVGRQPGSGTQLLTEHLLQQHGIDAAALAGDGSLVEDTHVAVAAAIASGLADVGLGVEAAALEFGLHFVPLVDEDYFLVCLKQHLDHPAVQRLRRLLAGDAWAGVLRATPGYAPPPQPGRVLSMTAALPWWRHLRARPRATPPAAGATASPTS
jgi:putative molybdopterin biosynthesis protein